MSARLCRAWLAFAALASCTPQARAPIGAPTAPTRTPAACAFVELDRTNGWGFRAHDFPALTANGTHVVLADGGDDRYAYAAALELRVRVASGEVTRTMGILSADEYHSAFDDDEARRARRPAHDQGRGAARTGRVRGRSTDDRRAGPHARRLEAGTDGPEGGGGGRGGELSVDLAACPSDLYYEPARRVVVVRMTYRCAGLTVGDSCSAPPAWFVVQTAG